MLDSLAARLALLLARPASWRLLAALGLLAATTLSQGPGKSNDSPKQSDGLNGKALGDGPASWPSLRGPKQDGRARHAKIPLEWSEEKNVRWKTEIHGRGWSTPVILDGKVWLTTATPKGKEMSVIAVDLESGKKLVDRVVFRNDKVHRLNRLNSWASPTAVVEKGRVYVHFGRYGTACLDAKDGATLWERRDFHCDHEQGPGSSPLLWKDLLVIPMDGNDVQYVIALDTKNGKTRWRSKRSADFTGISGMMQKAYGTPVAIEHAGKTQLICTGAVATNAYDPNDGKELWSFKHGGFSMSSLPLFDEEHVYVNTGFNVPKLVKVKLGGEGDLTESHHVWTWRRNVPTMPSSLLVDGRIYMVDHGGRATCLDAKSGKPLWRKRIGGSHCASPIFANGRIYYFDREGKTSVIAAKAEFEELASNELESGFMASPAVIGNALILRTTTHVYRIEESKPTPDRR